MSGPYLALLGASGTAAGLTAGAGELIASLLRLVFGHLSDRTRRCWGVTSAGYALSAVAAPALALAGSPAYAAEQRPRRPPSLLHCRKRERREQKTNR